MHESCWTEFIERSRLLTPSVPRVIPGASRRDRSDQRP
jgi:hypothetical protein